MPIVIISIMLTLFGGISYYISRRIFQGLIGFMPRLHFGFVLGFFLLMTVVMLTGFAASMLPIHQKARLILNRVGMYWMGIFIYLLIFTILTDVTALIFRISGFYAIRMACIVMLSLAVSLYGACHVNKIYKVSYEVTTEGKTDVSDMNIVMISDLHLGSIGSEKRLDKVVDEINALKPDLLCIAGDFFDTDFGSIQNPERAAEILKELDVKYGTYACLGNHDAGGTQQQMLDFLRKCGITTLREEYVVIDDRLILAGRLDSAPIGGFNGKKRGSFAELMDVGDTEMPVIVMDHNPANIGEYTTDADLILSGHTHKGQIFPGSLITDRMFEVDYGYYRRDESSPHVIVTSGVGYWGMPMRVGTDCEIVQIKING